MNTSPLLQSLIITHIFWDTFTSHGDKPSCIEETTYNLCFGDPLCRRLQKLVGNDKLQSQLLATKFLVVVNVGRFW